MTKHTDIPDGFDYQGDVYRPPTEAHNILIQATIGCSHNVCTFCAGQLGKRFTVKDQAVLERDLVFAERYCSRQDRVFVIDGNALTMPYERWLWLLENIRHRLPWVKGVGSFATALDVSRKSDAELRHLRELGLDRLYIGVESGLDEILKRIRKGIDAQGLTAQCRRVKNAGIELIVTVLTGIVDSGISQVHAEATGGILSAIDPDMVTLMTLIPMAGTPMHDEIARGELTPPDLTGLLREQRTLLEHTHMDGGLFDASHSSGYVSFQARMPGEKEFGLSCFDKAIQGSVAAKDNMSRRI